MSQNKLYIYDHCPYCTKARMIFGITNTPVKEVTLLNDDEKTPIELIGQKMVPIYTENLKQPMPESMDIVSYIQQKVEFNNLTQTENPEIMSWLSQNKMTQYQLAMPRWPKINLEEFKTPSSIEYFTKKKEAYIGNFDEALENSPALVVKMNQSLLELNNFSEFLTKLKTLSRPWEYTDFHLFAFLRGISVCKGLEFPESVKSYMEYISSITNIKNFKEY